MHNVEGCAGLPVARHSSVQAGLLAASLLSRGACPGFGRPRDWEDLGNMLCEHLAKGRGVARQRTPFVPKDVTPTIRNLYRCVRRADGIIATPWPASAIASRVWGARLSNLMFGKIWNVRARRVGRNTRRLKRAVYMRFPSTASGSVKDADQLVIPKACQDVAVPARGAGRGLPLLFLSNATRTRVASSPCETGFWSRSTPSSSRP